MTAGTLAATAVTRDGRETGVGLAGPGEVLLGGPEVRCSELEPSRWVVLQPDPGLDAWPDAVTRDPPPAAVVEACGRALAQSQEILVLASIGSAGARLAWWLAELAVRLGRRSGPAMALRRRITQETLARLAGISRETANRELRLLRRDGLVFRRGGRLVLTDLGALRSRAGP